MWNADVKRVGATLRRGFLAAVMCLATGAVSAGVITFDSLTGPNAAPFDSITEDGVTATSSSGEWQQAFNVGNPIPSIFTFSDSASITVTTGGLFDFVSFDLGTGGGGGPAYLVEQFLNSVLVHSFGGANATTAFSTIVDAFAGLVDQVVITTSIAGLTTSANIDNIRVNPAVTVAEPGSLAVLGLALGALAFSRRRRTA
jgi:hypothetical protein